MNAHTKATAGTWSVKDLIGTTDKGDTYIFDGNDNIVACVLHACLSKPADYATPTRITQARASARLIAAAPDLLEALRDLAAMADFVAQREPGMDELKARIADARAAIAKATESA